MAGPGISQAQPVFTVMILAQPGLACLNIQTSVAAMLHIRVHIDTVLCILTGLRHDDT